jgi:flagellar hook protein FlgE
VSLGTSVSGLNAARTLLDVGAHNIANASTAGFRPQRVEFAAQPPQQGVAVTDSSEAAPPPVAELSGTDLVSEMVGVAIAKTMYAANARAFQMRAETERYLVDERA